MFSVISNGGRSASIQTYLVDFKTDLNDIPLKNCTPGDQAFVIEEASWYILNHNKEWKDIIINSQSSNEGLSIWEGGEY